MKELITALVVIGIIVGILGLFTLFYIAIAARRRAITYKKVDYLVEDVTHKSELLTSTVETIAKTANYIDIFETVAKKNIKSAAKLISRNKDDIYKIAERIKKLALGKEEMEKRKKAELEKEKKHNGN